MNSREASRTEAGTAAGDAEGTGIDAFGVMDEIDLDDMRFTNPAFAYEGGVGA